MSFFVLMGLANPMTLLILATFYIAWLRFRERRSRGKRGTLQSRLRIASAAGLGAAFQFLSMAYRPDHAFVMKAQIQQHEDCDEDDDGSPDTPVKHLHQQLRRIRRGETVDRLVWRLD
ncbi:MAG TPA: hypothetical protein VGJ21_15755 [Terracidiphilus sp.]|jgi:hypothetical protein